MNTTQPHRFNRVLWLAACTAVAATLSAQDTPRDSRDPARDPTRDPAGTNPIVTPGDPTNPLSPTRDTIGMKLSRGDRNFLEEAHQSGMEEVALSQIAVTKAANPMVKDFAQTLIDEHNRVNTELNSLVTSKGAEIDMKKIAVSRWEKKSAKEFDHDYMEKMVDAHEKAVKLFEKQSTKGEDPQLTAFASKTLPALQAHLGKAREIQKSLK